MKAFVLYCNGEEFHAADDVVVRVCQHAEGEGDDPRDRPEEDCVDVPLSDLLRPWMATVEELLGLRVDAESLDEEARLYRRAQREARKE